MSEMTFVLAIVFITIVVPLWLLLHYITRWRQSRGLSREDEHMLEELWESAGRMEERIETLERILDEQNSEWRRPK
ncbi:phage shock protein B [Natronospira proteinivora]|uniref:Phage shock protein B n=2 Tax=Natronospira proteinivora TaxID=1807133 RepID=A0ABT1GAF1_9GAMM|nr:phage shock protein B [Natronospira proteinivora]